MTPEQGKMKIRWLIKNLNENLNDFQVGFYVEKIVANVLSYCHIEYFPESLTYDAAEIITRFLSETAAAADSETSIASLEMPLQKIKQDDTEYTFFQVDFYSGVFERMFDALKPKLNLYRRLISW